MSLVMSGIFQRCPDLKIVIAESGLTWVPSLMWRMDQEWKACRREVPWVQEPPSAYVRRHFRFTTAPNASGNVDAIADFAPSHDMIELSHAIFSAFKTGAVPNADVLSGTAAKTASQHLIYNAASGALSYDPDILLQRALKDGLSRARDMVR